MGEEAAAGDQRLRLIHGGKLLQDGGSVESSGLSDNDWVHCVISKCNPHAQAAAQQVGSHHVARATRAVS